MKMPTYENVKTFVHNHGYKLAVAGAAIGTMATTGSASVTTAVTNGSAILNGGIAIAQTEPLNWIIETIAVGIGAIFFVKIVRRLV